MMTDKITEIIIVGGGSAGWICAGLLAVRHGKTGSTRVRVTLIESPDVQILGVGEGTWPSMRASLKTMGIGEAEFLSCCDASFKQGSKFVGWGTGRAHDTYYHPFTLPQGYFDLDLTPHWLASNPGVPFAEAVGSQAVVCEQGLAPKLADSPDYVGVLNYGYHLDAGKFASLLKRHCTERLGVRYVRDHVLGVESYPNGDIQALRTREGGTLGADLFIDCSGSQGLLIAQHYRVDFIGKGDELFADTALAVQLPRTRNDEVIASHTLATAQQAGWIWDIGLPGRRGIGHVFSSAHQSRGEAERVLQDYLLAQGADLDADLAFRSIPIRPGFREHVWVNNCVAIGMAAGFLEPLEASALSMVEIAANTLCDLLPDCREQMPLVAARYNRIMRYNWEGIVDFLKLHYVASARRDSDFWRDNQRESSMSESLRERLLLWRSRAPSEYDFERKREVFPAASYLYVLAGMGWRPQGRANHKGETAYAERLFEENRLKTQRYLAGLPSNRALLDKIREEVKHGFSLAEVK
ncbi:tryptophan halogenase family protein [Pseudoalteromonas sp. T1lg75]|uniref:tryptophan halogenase family protein n=1 Tax=Pseudoalteromonas sp. T1lg75 TaxID=2077102 RepID=UPI001F372039|nr:tryptophan halogenase family protein [Pseudoalteromonas sp. T1lg75]